MGTDRLIAARQEAGTNLCEVVRLNEDIKRVMEISREVNLAAINAMLMAKKANGRVAGFGVVSAELRVFSSRLTGNMEDLVELIYSLVTQVAMLEKHRRMQRHFLDAAAQEETARQFLAGFLVRKESELECARQHVVAEKARLRLRLHRALQHCDTGRALSRSARIEAVYGGSMTASLTQVSRHAEATVEQVVSIFKSLEARLAE